MGCHFLLKGIFLTQELNSGLPPCRQILYPLGHQENPSEDMSLSKFWEMVEDKEASHAAVQRVTELDMT